MKPRLIVVGPLPPPVHGVTVSTDLVLRNQVLAATFDVAHLDTSDHRTGENIGRFDRENVRVGFGGVWNLARLLRGRPGLVYLPISQNRLAFLRDSIYIWVSRAAGWSVAIHLRGSDFPRFYRGLGPLFRLWVRATLRQVDSAGVMGRSLRYVFGAAVPAERTAVVPNGTPEPGAQADPGSSQIVLYVSNLRRRKGIREAVVAATLVASRLPGVEFLFAGEWEDQALEAEVRRLAAGFEDRIRFLAPVDQQERDRLLAAAAVFVFCPPEPEGHPRVVLEAVAAGLPVVATDRGAIAETVVDGVSGFVVDDASPEAIARHVHALMADPQSRREMGEAARRIYETRFTQTVADRAIADWLARTADGGHRRKRSTVGA